MNVPVRIAAPAKLNLYLHITGKRPDAYHLIESLVAFTSFGDVIEITPSAKLDLKLTGPFASSLAGDNLVMRAAKSLQAQTGCSHGAQITLHKNIPVGAGLGGGSSDAAATLRGLNKFWNVNVDDKTMHILALKLGSDVPVCLKPMAALIGGIGEQVTPVDITARPSLLLVNPGMELLTADVYRKFSGKFSPPSKSPVQIGSVKDMIDYIGAKHNALEAPAVALMPVINDVLAAIRATSGCDLARMSGSGATCFGLYENEALTAQAKLDVRRAHPTWWVQVTRLYDMRDDDHG